MAYPQVPAGGSREAARSGGVDPGQRKAPPWSVCAASAPSGVRSSLNGFCSPCGVVRLERPRSKLVTVLRVEPRLAAWQTAVEQLLRLHGALTDAVLLYLDEPLVYARNLGTQLLNLLLLLRNTLLKIRSVRLGLRSVRLSLRSVLFRALEIFRELLALFLKGDRIQLREMKRLISHQAVSRTKNVDFVPSALTWEVLGLPCTGCSQVYADGDLLSKLLRR